MTPLIEAPLWTAGLTLALLAAIYVPVWVWRWLTGLPASEDR